LPFSKIIWIGLKRVEKETPDPILPALPSSVASSERRSVVRKAKVKLKSEVGWNIGALKAHSGASFPGGEFQPFAVDNGDMLSADVKDVRVLQFIERIGDRFTIYAEALGEVLMRQSLHFIPFRRA